MAAIIMTTAYRDIEYEEYARGYREHFGSDAQMATRILAVDWADAILFKEDMLGFSRNEGGKLSRVLPEQHPDLPNLWCEEVQMINEEGAHGQSAESSGFVNYEKAVYACTYRAVPFRVVHDDELESGNEQNRFVIRRKKFAFEQQKVPGNDFKWSGATGKDWDNKLIGEVPALPISFVHMEYTVKAVPLDLIPELLVPANTINSVTFDDSIMPGGTRLGGYAAETVLYTGVDQREYWSAAGFYVADLVYSLAARSESWLKFPDPEGVMRKLVRVSDPTKGVFGTSDLNQLFVFTE